jgi:hypothetical protein
MKLITLFTRRADKGSFIGQSRKTLDTVLRKINFAASQKGSVILVTLRIYRATYAVVMMQNAIRGNLN